LVKPFNKLVLNIHLIKPFNKVAINIDFEF
jgi:hypothetical protein